MDIVYQLGDYKQLMPAIVLAVGKVKFKFVHTAYVIGIENLPVNHISHTISFQYVQRMRGNRKERIQCSISSTSL